MERIEGGMEDAPNLKLLIAFCLSVSSARGVGAHSCGSKLIMEEEEARWWWWGVGGFMQITVPP